MPRGLSPRELLTLSYFVVAILSAVLFPYESYFYSSGGIEEGWGAKDLLTNRVTCTVGFGLGSLLAISILAVIVLYLFLTRTYIGTAIRAVSQDRDAMALMGANPQRVYIVTSAVGGAMAGLAGALLIIQYSVHPFFGAQFGPLTFMVCVLGGLGNMVGAFIASFIMSEIIAIGGVVISTEMGYVIAFVVFIIMMFVRPGGILARRQ